MPNIVATLGRARSPKKINKRKEEQKTNGSPADYCIESGLFFS
jgi:hypothetical protein